MHLIDLVILDHGITVTPEQVSTVRGRSKRQAIARLVAERGDPLAWLRERGIRVALDTGFDRATTELLLGALGWRDTALDLQAGHNAGVRFNVGVLSGAHTRARLSAEPHTHLLATVADLPTLWSPG